MMNRLFVYKILWCLKVLERNPSILNAFISIQSLNAVYNGKEAPCLCWPPKTHSRIQKYRIPTLLLQKTTIPRRHRGPGGRTSEGAESKRRSLGDSIVWRGSLGGVWKEFAFRLVVNRKGRPARGWNRPRGPGTPRRALELPGLAARSLPGRRRDSYPADPRPPKVGFDMQSTDLGNKESGKIWHRKPSPGTRDG